MNALQCAQLMRLQGDTGAITETALQKAGGIVQSYFEPPTMGITELPLASGGTADGRPYIPANVAANGLVSFDALRVALRRNLVAGVAAGAAAAIVGSWLARRSG